MNMHVISKRAGWFLGLVFIGFIVFASSQFVDWKALQTVERKTYSAGDHPGNVFLKGETVTVKYPADMIQSAKSWHVLDDQGNRIKKEAISKTDISESSIQLGKLGIGWYRIEFLDEEGECMQWTTAAVLAPLAAPVPQDSPICVDGANAWFYRDNPEKQEQYARLAALCGINWIRDRLRWRDIQPQPDEMNELPTTYDTSADIQHRFGLKVLQVFHDTPPWAIEDDSRHGRFPRDLRIVYTFCKAMSERFKGKVQAWEPWNEANVRNFGGHTFDEMCSYQKAAYLGFKAGDPEVTVCWNVSTGVPTQLQTKYVLENETWPYYDTYNIHSYDWHHSYAKLWAPVRQAACGRPIWLTESDRGMKYVTEEPWYDLSPRGERLKAEFMAQAYASSLYAGCNRHFHFILGHYFEERNQVQFGLLRRDFTPRPSYVALAALGRLLAGAKCLGRWELSNQPNANLIAFRGKPDGEERDVLVAWTERPVDWEERGKTTSDWLLPRYIKIEKVYDYLGRSLGEEVPRKLKSSAIFIMMPKGEAEKLPLQRLERSAWREGNPSPIVLQVQMPLETIMQRKEIQWAHEYEYFIGDKQEIEITIDIYNFSQDTAQGTLSVDLQPTVWSVEPKLWDVSLDSMERKQIKVSLTRLDQNSAQPETWIRMQGYFSPTGKPELAFRIISNTKDNQ